MLKCDCLVAIEVIGSQVNGCLKCDYLVAREVIGSQVNRCLKCDYLVARRAISSRNWNELAQLMNDNFALRR